MRPGIGFTRRTSFSGFAKDAAVLDNVNYWSNLCVVYGHRIII